MDGFPRTLWNSDLLMDLCMGRVDRRPFLTAVETAFDLSPVDWKSLAAESTTDAHWEAVNDIVFTIARDF